MVEAATIDDGEGRLPCVILDLSEGGAGLRLADAEQVCPETFILEWLDGTRRTCALRWHKDSRVGAEFIESDI